MPVIHAQDKQFAAATGDNVDATPRTSLFDAPPSDFDNLVITSLPDDPSPFLFEEGDTYAVSYSGPSGPVTLANATVIRSDSLGSPDNGIVVFEGVDPEEGLVQIAWTPGFDFEAWYQNASTGHGTPGFYSYDTQSATYGHVCFAAGTRIRTPSGLQVIETLRPGDLVQTRDNGARPLCWVGRRRVLGVGNASPVLVAPGVLGNDAPLRVSQQHRMLLRGRWADLLFGETEVLVPAKALINGRSIRLAPQRQVTYLHLHLEAHEVLDAEGAAAESLYLGDVARMAIGAADHLPAAATDAGRPPASPGLPACKTTPPARAFLSAREGAVLAAHLLKNRKPSQARRIPA